jgi:hypothetical protein
MTRMRSAEASAHTQRRLTSGLHRDMTRPRRKVS